MRWHDYFVLTISLYYHWHRDQWQIVRSPHGGTVGESCAVSRSIGLNGTIDRHFLTTSCEWALNVSCIYIRIIETSSSRHFLFDSFRGFECFRANTAACLCTGHMQSNEKRGDANSAACLIECDDIETELKENV